MISFPSLVVYSNLDPPLTLQGLDFDEEREELSVPPTLPSAQHSPPWALCSLVSPLDRIQFCFFVFECLHLCVDLSCLWNIISLQIKALSRDPDYQKRCFNGTLKYDLITLWMEFAGGTCHADLIAFLSKTVAFNPLPMPTPLCRHPISLLLLFSLTFFVHFLPPPPFPFFTKAKLFSTLYDIIWELNCAARSCLSFGNIQGLLQPTG